MILATMPTLRTIKLRKLRGRITVVRTLTAVATLIVRKFTGYYNDDLVCALATGPAQQTRPAAEIHRKLQYKLTLLRMHRQLINAHATVAVNNQ